MRPPSGALITRIALIVLGLILGAYGAVLVWENPPVIIMRILVWALVGVVLHDAVFAPVCVALGFAGRRLIPGKLVGAHRGGRVLQCRAGVPGDPGVRQTRYASRTI